MASLHEAATNWPLSDNYTILKPMCRVVVTETEFTEILVTCAKVEQTTH